MKPTGRFPITGVAILINTNRSGTSSGHKKGGHAPLVKPSVAFTTPVNEPKNPN